MVEKSAYFSDVIIIGAGPAGNAAALHLGNQGLKSIVIDYRENIGDKLCTGVIGLECASVFNPSGDIVYGPVNEVSVYAPSGEKYVLGDRNTRALVVDRVSYVKKMAESAISLGAEYLVGCRANSINIKDSGVEVEAECCGKSVLVLAPMVLITSGFGTRLLSQVALNRNKSSDYLIGTQLSVVSEGLESIKLFTGSEVSPGSFAWLVPTNESQALLGVVSRSKNTTGLKHLTNKLLEKNIVSKVLTKHETWGIPLRPISKTYGSRVLVAGDAAGFAKPTTGGGIYYSMISGRLAAETIAKCAAMGSYNPDNLSVYEESWKEAFGAELQTGYQARLLYECLDDDALNVILKKFSSREVQENLLLKEDFSFDRHASVISNAVQNKEIYALLTSLGSGIPNILARLLKRLFLEAVYR